MKRLIPTLFVVIGLVAQFAAAESPRVVLTSVRGHVYVAEDYLYSKENSVIYVGEASVTVVGATWTPETAKLLAAEIAKITSKPITEVIDTNYHPDRAGGNAYFKSIGAKIVSTKLTSDLLDQHWNEMVHYVQRGFPSYPTLPLVSPTQHLPATLNYKAVR
jgi:metallo-beta-lactamase class B